jgi:hypothetical protein
MGTGGIALMVLFAAIGALFAESVCGRAMIRLHPPAGVRQAPCTPTPRLVLAKQV